MYSNRHRTIHLFVKSPNSHQDQHILSIIYRVVVVVLRTPNRIRPTACTEWTGMDIMGRIVIGMSAQSHFRFDKNILPSQLAIGSIEYFNLLCFWGSFRTVESIFANTASCNSVETHVAHIFHLVCFQMDSGFLPAYVSFNFNLIQQSAKKI